MKKKKAILITLVVVLAVVLIGVITVYALFKHYYGMMNHETLSETPEIQGSIPEDETEEGTDSPEEEVKNLEEQLKENLAAGSQELEYDHDVYNVLLFGTDSRDDNAKGRSDSMILISINRKENRITMTSLMRDIYVSIPGVGNNRLNASYAFGGPSLLLQTIEENLGVHIDRYVQVNFFAFMDVIDILGGIDLDISADEITIMNRYIEELNRITGNDRDVEKLDISDAGTRHLTGKQALAYCRIRYLKGGEYERTRRQRDVLGIVFQKAKSCSLSELNDLLNALLPDLTTNIPEGEMISLVLESSKLLKYDLESDRIPVEGTYKDMRIDKRAVIGIDFPANRQALQDIMYGTR